MTSINDIAIVYEKILTITIEKRGSSDDSSKFDSIRCEPISGPDSIDTNRCRINLIPYISTNMDCNSALTYTYTKHNLYY
jgi:hypothetical protein